MCMYIPHYVMLLDIQMLESFHCTLLSCTAPKFDLHQYFGNDSVLIGVVYPELLVIATLCVCVASSPCYYSGNATAATFIATKQ